LPDLEKAVKGRRKNLQRIWSSKEWKEKKGEFLSKNPWCAMHLTIGQKVPARVPHHPYRNSYKGHYTDLELSGCVAYCIRCHYALHHGRILCKKCGESYHLWDQEMCLSCYLAENPGIAEAIAARKLEIKRIQKEIRKKQAQKARDYKREAKS